MKQGFVSLHLLAILMLLFGMFNTCKSSEDQEDSELGDAENDNDSMSISADDDKDNDAVNKNCSRSQNSLTHEIQQARLGQFPFVVAVMSEQNEYLCSGALVSNGMILTTATCLKEYNISYVLANTTKAVKGDNAIILRVVYSVKFPTFQADETKDVGILYVDRHNHSEVTRIRISNYTASKGLAEMEAIGFGLNLETHGTRELQYVGFEHRPAYDEGDIMKGYLDCIETKVVTCFRDTGSPVIFNNELVGIVIKGQPDCIKEMSSSYSVNKAMANILPTYVFKTWLDDRIAKNELNQKVTLVAYPDVAQSENEKAKEIRRVLSHIDTSSGSKPSFLNIFVLLSLLLHFFKV